jgi:hypothetical protein
MILLTRSLFTQMALDQTGRRGCGGQPGAFRQCPHYPMDCLGKTQANLPAVKLERWS